MKCLLAPVLLALGTIGYAQSTDDLLAQYEGAARQKLYGECSRLLSELLNHDDPRTYRLFVNSYFNDYTSNQAKWCLIRVGKRAFPAGWAKIASNPKAFAGPLFSLWARCGPGGGKEILKGLSNTSRSIQEETMKYLAPNGSSYFQIGSFVGYPEWGAAVVTQHMPRFFKSRDPDVRRACVSLVQHHASPKLVKEMYKLKRDSDPRVRAAVVRVSGILVLANIDPKQAEPIAFAGLTDRAQTVRLQAFDSLSWGYSKHLEKYYLRWANRMVDLLRHKDTRTRARALSYLAAWVSPDGWFGPSAPPPSKEEIRTTSSINALLRKRSVGLRAFAMLSDATTYPAALTYLTYTDPDKVWSRLLRDVESPDYLKYQRAANLISYSRKAEAVDVLNRLDKSKHGISIESYLETFERLLKKGSRQTR